MTEHASSYVRPDITDEEIIAYYKAGLSQKDIVRLYNTTYPHTKNVLRAAGFDTGTFRRIPHSVKETILALCDSGATYTAIEDICDISFDAIRDISKGQKDDTQSRKRWLSRSQRPRSHAIFPGRAAFAMLYQSGSSFCAICEAMNLPTETRVQLFWEIYNKDFAEINIPMHRQALYQLIRADYASGFSVTAIARKHFVSKTVVRTALET